MDAWIKIFVVMIMFSALSMVMTYFLVSPLIGLILLGIVLTLLVITLEPATGKSSTIGCYLSLASYYT